MCICAHYMFIARTALSVIVCLVWRAGVDEAGYEFIRCPGRLQTLFPPPTFSLFIWSALLRPYTSSTKNGSAHGTKMWPHLPALENFRNWVTLLARLIPEANVDCMWRRRWESVMQMVNGPLIMHPTFLFHLAQCFPQIWACHFYHCYCKSCS